MFPFHRWTRLGGPRLSPSEFLPAGPRAVQATSPRSRHACHRPISLAPAVPTWRGRHHLQAGIGAAIVAAALVRRALEVGPAAGHLTGARGQRARGWRTAVLLRLPRPFLFLGLREEGSVNGTPRSPQTGDPRWMPVLLGALKGEQVAGPLSLHVNAAEAASASASCSED